MTVLVNLRDNALRIIAFQCLIDGGIVKICTKIQVIAAGAVHCLIPDVENLAAAVLKTENILRVVDTGINNPDNNSSSRQIQKRLVEYLCNAAAVIADTIQR